MEKYYQIIYDLERQFETLQAAKDAYPPGSYLKPRIPRCTMASEDQATKRICVAKTLTDCITAIRVCGPFKRCLAANDCVKSYAEVLHEAYPILVLEIETDITPIKPTVEQVPDVEYTNELWFLEPVQITRRKVKWLSPYSIRYREGNGYTVPAVCTSVRGLRSWQNNDHPWLNGKGHILMSSLMDYEPEEYNFQKMHQEMLQPFTGKDEN